MQLLPEFNGRRFVVRTHPQTASRCVLTAQVELPVEGKSFLAMSTTHHPQGDWRLVVRVNGEQLHRQDVGPKTVQDGWLDLRLDLTRWAGQSVQIEVENWATDWAWEFAFWEKVLIETEAPAP